MMPAPQEPAEPERLSAIIIGKIAPCKPLDDLPFKLWVAGIRQRYFGLARWLNSA